LCGLSVDSLDRHVRVLERKGLICVQRRKLPGRCRENDTNVYTAPVAGFDEGSRKDAAEKSTEKTLKANTLTREKPREVESPPGGVEITPPRAAWEARRERDREDHHWMRTRYEAVGAKIEAEVQQRTEAREENRRFWREGRGQRWAKGREYRHQMAIERTRRAGRVEMTKEQQEEARLALEKSRREYVLAAKEMGFDGYEGLAKEMGVTL
jgi:hypothetical protein